MQDGDKEAASLTSSIRFDNVSFSHENGVRVLHGVSVEVNRGEMLAVVGASGGGKSTLCDLLLRLHDPDEGRVLFDGGDIRGFMKKSYLRHFGVVPQESLFLNATVRENILYGRKMDRALFDDAIRIANAREFIAALPEGEETLIGDRGVRLSGGQRQRLAIARAVFGRPEILVLDEATSALDTESELAVQQAIDNAVHDMTAVVVAHRLSTVMHADRIVVLADGRVEAVGPHRELLVTSPTYSRLYSLQFRENMGFTTAQTGMACVPDNLAHIEQIIAKLKHPTNLEAIPEWPVWYKGKLILYLRAVRARIDGMASKDAYHIATWRNTYKTSFFTWITLTEELTKNWLVKNYVLDNREIIFMIETSNHVPFGHVAFSNFNKDGSECEFGRVLRGSKLGPVGGMTIGSFILLLWAAEQLKISNFFLEVFESNNRAISFYKHLGFVATDRIALKRIESDGGVRWEKIQNKLKSGILANQFALRMEMTGEQLCEAVERENLFSFLGSFSWRKSK